MAMFQKEYDDLTAENAMLRSTAKPSIVPHGNTYDAIKNLLEYLNDGATDMTTSTPQLANAITMSIFGSRGLTMSNNRSAPLLMAADGIRVKMAAINEQKRMGVHDLQQSKRHKKNNK